MSEEADQEPSSEEDHETPSGPFAHEDELREEASHVPLGGADVEHCQRMRG
ncbi:MAG TPA: hypothetical protein VFF06_12980 [Polyangia bacterium]|nr:hypothetical protein [Polyangia bacterium]